MVNRKSILSVFVLLFLLQSIVCLQFSVSVRATVTSTAMVDLFSQKGGNGPNQPDGSFALRERVILYAHVTNNSSPVQDVVVVFEVYGPPNLYDNITIFRTAITNTSGVAAINFTIPHPCEHIEEVLFGRWTAYASVQLPEQTIQDMLTFMVFEEHDVAVKNITLSKTIVCQGYSMSINATVGNHGMHIETFDVTVYANTTAIGTQTVNNMPNGTSTVLTYTWNTIGFAKGNYIISANATIVTNETDTDDNYFIDGTVRVTMVGDVNGDGKVTITDIVIIALAFGEPPYWICNADINNDGKITITDVVIAALHFGETDP